MSSNFEFRIADFEFEERFVSTIDRRPLTADRKDQHDDTKTYRANCACTNSKILRFTS